MKNEKLPSAPVPQDQVTWPVGRDMIQSGDLISFFTSHEESALHRVTTESVQFFTGSRIYHTGIAVWVTPDGHTQRRLMLCEAVGVGRRLVNMSKFADHKMEIHAVPPGLDRIKIVDYMLSGIGTSYSFWNLAAIAMSEFFGYEPRRNKKSQVCSETAALAWQAGGFSFGDQTTSMSPGRLRNFLGTRGAPPTLLINPDAGE